MKELERILRQEQKRINALLEKESAALPPMVRPVAEHILRAGGKRLRPLLTVLTARVFGCEHPDIYTLAVATEFVHVATLLHDDIYDNAGTRRGVASAHKVFGATPSMLAGDAMLGQAADIVARLNMPALVSCFAKAIIHTASGEVAEFSHMGNISLGHEDYLEIITGKTAWALRAACEVAAIRAGASTEAVAAAAEFGLEIGIAFQIVDDALDIAPGEKTGKPAGGDIREGKCTPPIRFYRESLPPREAEDFARKFREKNFTDAEVRAAIKAMRALGCDERTRTLADFHLAKAEKALSFLPAGAGRDILAQVPEFIRTRGH